MIDNFSDHCYQELVKTKNIVASSK